MKYFVAIDKLSLRQVFFPLAPLFQINSSDENYFSLPNVIIFYYRISSLYM